ncbi:MAG: type IV pilus biogenesis/stability protein PilW [Pseudomonadaceae bacterium]|nr:type IV pilus biogenesis/stability protein PilW [Pseudomonadaceae bacterium]
MCPVNIRAAACTVLIAMVCSVSGCVTESSGGLPEPGTVSERTKAQLDLARGYIEQRDFNRARTALDSALEIDSRNVEAHVLSAVLLHAQGEYELAEFHYKTALRLDPDNPQALNNYGTFLYSRGRFDDAVVPLARLVRDTGYRARSQAFENLGLAYLRAGRKDDAKAALTRALDLNFRQATAILELAELAYDEGKFAQAASMLADFKAVARQNARSLCLGIKVAKATDDVNLMASNQMALSNLFPDQAGQCQTDQ